MWRIFYADGSYVSSEDCAPADVPGYGIEAIAQSDPTVGTGNVGYVVLTGHDWYFWRSDIGQWDGVQGDNAIWDLILHRAPIVGVCAGRKVPDEVFLDILKEARKWAGVQGLPRKSGVRPDERPR